MERRLPPGPVCRGKGRLTFLVWAPDAERVDLRILQPGSRLVPMQRIDGGYHGIEIDGVRPASLYVYRLDGLIERPDPASRCQPLGPRGPSLAADTRFAWKDGQWPGMPLRDYVLADPPASDEPFDEIRSRLGEISARGFTALRVRSGSGPFPFSASAERGGADGLKRLVDACHRRGLAVMLAADLFTPGMEGDPFVSFGPYFEGRSRRIRLDGPLSDEVRRYFIECALHWFREFHVDAIDAGDVDGLTDPSPTPLLEEMVRITRCESERIGRPLHLVARSGRNDPRLIRLREDGGIGLDAVWNSDFDESLNSLLHGPRKDPGTDFGRVEHVQKAFLEGFVCSGGYSPARQHRHGRSSRILPGERFLVSAPAARTTQGPEQGSAAAKTLFDACLLLSPFLPLMTAEPANSSCRIELIRLRKELRNLGLLDKQCMGVLGYEKEKALLVRYWKDDADLVVLFHFARKAAVVRVPIPAGVWALRFDSADRRWDGPGGTLPELLQGDGGDVPLPFAPLSCAVYLRRHGA